MNQIRKTQLFTALSARSNALVWLVAALIFATGLLVRLSDLRNPPLDFNATRQLHSALIARGMYYEHLDTAEPWQRELAVRQWKAAGLIEPPIMERLSALGYRLNGDENLMIPRLYAIIFWMTGSVFVFLLARDLAGGVGGLAALAYFLAAPYGIHASRSFQPEALMVAALVAAWWAMWRWHGKPTWGNALLAGLLAGFAIFVKVVAVFLIGGAWLGLLLPTIGLRGALRNRQVWLMAVLTVLPYIVYHIYGVYISGALAAEFENRIFPRMWITPSFYWDWLKMAAQVVGFGYLLTGLVGIALIQNRIARRMFFGIMAGYVVFAFVLSYHMSTHPYYQEPLLPITGLGLGVLAAYVLARFPERPRVAHVLFVSVLLLTTAYEAYSVYISMRTVEYSSEVTTWEERAKLIEPRVQAIGLVDNYAHPLAYWGWMDISNIKSTADIYVTSLAGAPPPAQQDYEAQFRGKDIFVVTMLDEFKHREDLYWFVKNRYPQIVRENGMQVFDLRQSVETDQP